MSLRTISVTVFAAACLVACAASSPLHFEAACNYPCSDPCPSAAAFGLLPWNATVTGGITTHRDFGGWPMLAGTDHKDVVNGGVPQAGNLSLHLEIVADDVRRRVPDENFSGRIAIDFEAWAPTWVLPHHGRDEDPYHLYSMALVRKQQPAIAGNDTAVEEIAKEQFEAAALRFFVATLRRIRAMRPRALAGYYGFPFTTMGGCQDIKWFQPQFPKECGYANPSSATWRAANDRMAPIWAASSALYPSTYLQKRSEFEKRGHPQISNASWRAREAVIVGSVVKEAVRLSTTYGGGIPVLAFGWGLYWTPPAYDTAVVSADMEMWINAVWQPPHSTGVVLWGYPNSTVQQTAMTTITGPALLAAKKATAVCAATLCSGNGWCSDVRRTKTTTCVCRPGWNGAACATAE
jgi:hypothetical protein